MNTAFDGELNSFENMRQNSAVVAYGSSMHPNAIDEAFGDFNPLAIPVDFKGYKRVFNNRSAWRKPEGKQSAVLNVVPDPEHRCNAILIVIQRKDLTDAYEQNKESGYDFERVSLDQVEPYTLPNRYDLNELNQIKVPIGNRVEPDIEPFLSYVEECLEGAKWWDERFNHADDVNYDESFLEDFIHTTELADGTPFADYLCQKSIKITSI